MRIPWALLWEAASGVVLSLRRFGFRVRASAKAKAETRTPPLTSCCRRHPDPPTRSASRLWAVRSRAGRLVRQAN
eukprot:4994855-Alexandrium_andersonii.AAC.1